MDGYAVLAADVVDGSAVLTVIGEARAGAPFDGAVVPGAAVAVSTGAVLPRGADAVVRVERTEQTGARVEIRGGHVVPGADVRPAGDDLARGHVAMSSGTRIGAGERAMLAALGVVELAVVRRARVAIVATGDETVQPGRPLRPGAIYESNSVMIGALAREAGADTIVECASVPDTRAETRSAIAGAIDQADVTIVCGGVSMGAHDHVRPALAELGVRQVFWQLALRPGHPTWFGHAGDRLVFGLPGNPVSAYVTFQLLVRTALDRMHGRTRTRLAVPAVYRGPDVHSPAGTTTVIRCRLGNDPAGLIASPTAANQRSHAVTSLVGVDAFALIPESRSRIVDGDLVDVHPLQWASAGV